MLGILEAAGAHCAALLDAKVRNLPIRFIECDEVFSWVGCKPDKVEESNPARGTFFTFLSIAKYEKLIINYRVAKRTGEETTLFLQDLKSRLAERPHIVTDAFRGYVAVSSQP